MIKFAYGYRIMSFWSEEDGEFVVTCPSFPSLSVLDKSESAAFFEFLSLLRFTILEYSNKQ